MKKKLYFAALALTGAVTAAAQDTYESARVLGSDLNGTARYVGMGGAMEALGADISTASTNPAGVGLFRHSMVSVSAGLVSQQDAKNFDKSDKTNLSFDQLGFVYSMRLDRSSFINLSFNYHKQRNFNQILSIVDGKLRNSSLNLNTAEKSLQGYYDLGESTDGTLIGYESPTSSTQALNYSQLDYLNANALSDEEVFTDSKGATYNSRVLHGMEADSYNYNHGQRGWITQLDFTLSGNVNDRFYWGFNVGVHDVNYKGSTIYSEGLRFQNGENGGLVHYDDEMRKITGTGFEVTAGVIFRPVEYSPFRIGLSISTPTWYSLKTSNFTSIVNESALGNNLDGTYITGGDIENVYEFKYYTPWKFGLSVGHTIGTQLALGAGVEYSDYGASENRVNSGRVDYYGSMETYTDQPMKDNTERSLKGVATFKLGAEFKPSPELAIRLGYNYLTAAYSKDGVRDQTLRSYGVKYATTSDYTNWEGTNRVTCGAGYKLGGVNIDLAYQYSQTNGTFFPFQPGLSGGVDGVAVSNKRHQVLLTLGYTF